MAPEQQQQQQKEQEKNMATAEVISMPPSEVSAPPQSCMIAAVDLWKTYDMGSEHRSMRCAASTCALSAESMLPSWGLPVRANPR